MTTDAIEGYLDEMSSVLGKIGADQVQSLVDAQACTNNATVFICGNGCSASTASHMATGMAKQTAVAGMGDNRYYGAPQSLNGSPLHATSNVGGSIGAGFASGSHSPRPAPMVLGVRGMWRRAS